MAWKAYRLKLLSKSPIHIGYRKLGIVAQTRYYLPAKNFWAALTAYLTKEKFENPTAKNYEDMGRQIGENIRFSYFFPAIEDEIFYPNYAAEGFKFGARMTREEFETRFIDSKVGTAVDQTSRTALEEMAIGRGSLNETEFLRTGIEYVGYCFVRNVGSFTVEDAKVKLDEKSLENSFEEALFFQGIGGERNYGFGRLELQEFSEHLGGIFTTYQLVSNDELLLEWKDGENPILFAHTLLKEGITAYGDLELVVGREWYGGKGSGQKVQASGIRFVPGTKMDMKSLKIKIADLGYWEIV